MPLPSLEITSTLLDRRSEPTLTAAIRTKIALLPSLKRQQLFEQQARLEHDRLTQNDLAETRIQSFDQGTDPANSHPNKIKNASTTKYTTSAAISQTMPAMMSPHHDSILSTPQNGLVHVDSQAYPQPSPPIVVTDFNAHCGETAVMTAPIVGDDLISRLDGLRQFKDWTARIHDNTHNRAQLATKEVDQDHTIPLSGTLIVEKYSPSRIADRSSPNQDGGRSPHDEFRIVERVVIAPTPFCSPHVTPVPCVEASGSHQKYSASPPSLGLPGKLPQDRIAYIIPRAHSRTIIISSQTPSVQLTQPSSTVLQPSPPESGQSRQRAGSKSRSHPPISFPKDFYERFPDAGCLPSQSTPQCQGLTKPTPGVSPKTIAPDHGTENDIPEPIESLATTHDKRGRPEFYTMIHYFTDCPHSCPPANRPLDAKSQPRDDLNFRPTRKQPCRSVIPGACFNCDLISRRKAEDEIGNSCTADLAELAEELANTLDELELGESASNDEGIGHIRDEHSAGLLTPSCLPEEKDGLGHSTRVNVDSPSIGDKPDISIAQLLGKLGTSEKKSYKDRLIMRVRDLEMAIHQVREEQEEQIKKAWIGFTPRWGPATLGVQRRLRADSTSRSEFHEGPSTGDNRANTSNELLGTENTNTSNKDDTLNTDNNVMAHDDLSQTMSGSSSGQSRSRSRSRSDTPCTTSSATSHRDLPGSRTPGEGKMRIGWIREDKS